MKLISSCCLLVLAHCLSGQGIHSLEPISAHYKTLAQKSAEADPQKKEMDAISFPMTGRTSGRQFIGLAPSYLSDEDVNLLKDYRHFPANSSAQTRAELDFLLDWQNKRTAAQRNRAMEIAVVGYWPPMDKESTDYGDVSDLYWEYDQIGGSAINTDEYPTTTKLLAGVTRDMRIMEFTIKYHLKRPRPYHLESRIDPMGRVSNPSFASGHTLWAYIQAFTWSELLPERRQEFLDIAFEVGQSREIMGIHYPSDEEASRQIAHKMLTLMLENKAFVEDLNAARAEWK